MLGSLSSVNETIEAATQGAEGLEPEVQAFGFEWGGHLSIFIWEKI